MSSLSPAQPTAAVRKESLTVIIPAYNEEANLESIVRSALDVLTATAPGSEVIIVDDGSSDATGAIADRLASEVPSVRAVHHEANRGSGMAIRTGIAAARCDLVMYIPADGQFVLEEIGAYMDAASNADIVVGVRDSRSDYSWFRRLSSWTFLHLTNFLFRFHYRDVNWVHLWRRRIFDEIKPRSSGVFLMEEILVLAAREGCKSVEIGSVYRPRAAGKAKGASFRSVFVAVRETFRLWFDLHLPGRRRMA
jgi:glycosyltransferase involved in cell wall biosynthesis